MISASPAVSLASASGGRGNQDSALGEYTRGKDSRSIIPRRSLAYGRAL